jgi:DNA invertase Pin-like site-specific DNA recombinase
MSSERQLRGDSLARQEEMRDAFVAEHDLALDDTLRDLGVSAFDGSNRERGALAAFLRKVRAGEIQSGSWLLVESLDRLSRDHVLKALRVFQDILEAGITVATIGDGYVYTEERINRDWTQLIVSLSIMSRAHEESARKSDRLIRAWRRKREDSTKKLTKRGPAWLTLSEDRTKWIVNEHRAGIARRVLEELASGIGRDKIARRLNAGPEVELPWTHGRQWHGGTVQKLTDNEALIGKFQPHRIEYRYDRKVRVPVGEPIEGYYPRVVSDDLWLRARAASDARARQGRGNAGGRRGTVFSNLFSGLVTCHHCGEPMNYRDRGARSSVVLRCSSERNGTCHNAAKIPYAILEREILRWAEMHKHLGPADDAELPIRERLAAAAMRKKDVAERIEHLLDLAEIGEQVRERLLQKREELAALAFEESAAKRELAALCVGTTVDQRRSLITAVRESAGREEKDRYAARAAANQALREVLDEMRCRDDGRVIVRTGHYGSLVTLTADGSAWDVWRRIDRIAA